ncbi:MULTISPECIES: hypothetical protein [unclassified Colwellia]|uniref:hypothetical protein n=1 Tax=unclassified Colwellia TaxID=196834 RepID=UPI0015F47CD6|nr:MULTISPECIES: hypothetical protein [unclassified Colwellia]MBA6235112.1 hypothetical protein [Colwellia sp. MB02u-11]MBA6257501.1 hypothetical protein [Colwellia sp. MB3u-28]MBA6260573.1 hypothetical protein [Colwellia sp. MB3u-41]MBA6301679.1 hypothetical protein [Colwellia sp. MB3u-22]
MAKRIDQIFTSKSLIGYMKRHVQALRDIVVGDVVSSVEVMIRQHQTKENI